MRIQMISYDLVKPIRDYPKLFEAIESFADWCHCLESVWLVRTNLTSDQVGDRLKAYVDNDDKLMVLGLDGDWATLNLSKVCVDWFRENL